MPMRSAVSTASPNLELCYCFQSWKGQADFQFAPALICDHLTACYTMIVSGLGPELKSNLAVSAASMAALFSIFSGSSHSCELQLIYTGHLSIALLTEN